jgi:hypothetical protein
MGALAHGRIGAWTHWRMDALAHGRIGEWTHWRMDALANGRIGEWTHWRMDALANGRNGGFFIASIGTIRQKVILNPLIRPFVNSPISKWTLSLTHVNKSQRFKKTLR